MFERVFPADRMSKRERVERTLNHQSVDRAAILEQLSYNPGVIAMYTGKDIRGSKAIADLINCGADEFYCLKTACGMDIVELKRTWPSMVWAGGLDGVDLMERGTSEQVRATVQRQIHENNVLQTGGVFVATSAEINPPVRPENFKAMVEAVGEMRNPTWEK